MNNKKIFSIIFCFLSFNILFSQNYIDSIVASMPLTKIDKINRARDLLYEQIFIVKNKDIQFIKKIQNYLNNINDSSCIGISFYENLLLYVYIRDWDNVLNTISKMTAPYKINHLSFHGEMIFLQKQRRTSAFFTISKSQVVNKQFYVDISNSDLSKEQKEFIGIFIPKYLGCKFTQNNIKIKSAYKSFKKKYPKSQYLKYINNEK